MRRGGDRREYNGEVKQRTNVVAMQRVDYAAESASMLEQIARLNAAAAKTPSAPTAAAVSLHAGSHLPSGRPPAASQ